MPQGAPGAAWGNRLGAGMNALALGWRVPGRRVVVAGYHLASRSSLLEVRTGSSASGSASGSAIHHAMGSSVATAARTGARTCRRSVPARQRQGARVRARGSVTPAALRPARATVAVHVTVRTGTSRTLASPTASGSGHARTKGCQKAACNKFLGIGNSSLHVAGLISATHGRRN